MSRYERILNLVQTHIPEIIHLELVDESHQHSVPEGAESHFKLLLVSSFFSDQSRVQRQRKIYDLVTDELQSGLHAFTLRLLTEEEWETQKTAFQSPDCQGANKL